MASKHHLLQMEEVVHDTHHFQDMLDALETGDETSLKTALSHLSSKDINTCFTFAPDDVFSIPLLEIPFTAIQKDLSDLDEVYIYPIHYATMMGNTNCLEILLDAGADPNLKDSFGQTILHILPKSRQQDPNKDYEGCLDALLKHNNLRINRRDLSNSTPLARAENISWQYMTNKLNHMEQNERGEDLLRYILENDFTNFRNSLNAVNQNSQILDESHGSYTLLQYACRSDMTHFVNELLVHKASPTHKDKVNLHSPIIWASRYGYHTILNKLIDSLSKEDLQNGALMVYNHDYETPLHLSNICENIEVSSSVDYAKCLHILVRKKAYLNLDAQDHDGNTALHYAVLCKKTNIISTLLRNGANATIKNLAGLCPIHYISKEGIMDVLDDAVEFDRKIKLVDSEFWISLNYSMMNIKSDEHHNNNKNNGDEAKNTELNFLNMVTDIFKDKDILSHPLLDIFIFLKWRNIRKYFWINFIIHILFIILIVSYISLYHSKAQLEKIISGSVNSENERTDYGKISLITITLLTLLLREIVQLFMVKSVKDYASGMKNIIEVINVILTIALLCLPLSVHFQMGMAAWLILFSIIEFILHVGQMPKFSVYIAMLNAVAWNFFKFICLFAIIILAFCFSFYLIFQIKDASINDDFKTFPEAMLKTIIMTTGEIDYGDLPMSTFQGASHILMVIFVFLVLLVLMNLLNGLAISDIQVIQQRAEVISCTSLIDRMAQLEKAFYCMNNKNPFKKILDWLFGITLTFKSCIPTHNLKMYISRHAIQYTRSDGTEDLSICKCHSHKLTKSHIQALKSIILKKKRKFH